MCPVPVWLYCCMLQQFYVKSCGHNAVNVVVKYLFTQIAKILEINQKDLCWRFFIFFIFKIYFSQYDIVGGVFFGLT